MENYTNFCFSTFCFGERYQNQVNRFISMVDSGEFHPFIVVVTDNPEKILNKPFVRSYNISEFNPQYSKFANTYYEFDFSVKRYSLLAALNLGYNKIILCDADVVPNPNLFTPEFLNRGFQEDSILGQVTYNFSNEIITSSELGKRFIEYEKYFGDNFDKKNLDFMPEDCIQFIQISTIKFYNFLRVWDQCIQYKYSNNLRNVPAGNIDEMCFSALKCGIKVGNNSDKVINSIIPIHDKWYDSNFEPKIIPEKKEKKTIVTSIYQLNYISERGSNIYKHFDLLTETIRAIIFENYNYVIFTDYKTLNEFNLKEIFDFPNVSIKIHELNQEFYLNYLEPIRKEKIRGGEIWDRIFSVDNYVEVMYNKFEQLLEVSREFPGEVCWIDAGLFGTSCNDGWRDYLKENLVHSQNFLDKVFQKIDAHEFIALKGENILMNYEAKEKLENFFGGRIYISPGGIFGGKSQKILEYFQNYKIKIREIIKCLGEYTSDQEVLYLLIREKNCFFFSFEDWNDLQRAILKLLDLYDEDNYQTHTFKEKKLTFDNHQINTEEKISLEQNSNNFTEIADFCGIDKGSLYEGHMYTKVYEKYMTSFSNKTPTIVEIGINDTRFPGGCLRFWNRIFENMNYFGFDITDCSHLEYNRNKIQIYQGDQNNENDLKNFIEKFNIGGTIDFIIDDGSHIHEHILTSFKTLFKYLNCGGIYFIEDLHASQANREETINKIELFLQENFEYGFEIIKDNYKLLIIKKKCYHDK